MEHAYPLWEYRTLTGRVISISRTATFMGSLGLNDFDRQHGKVVFRSTVLFDNSGVATHGTDTSHYGVRSLGVLQQHIPLSNWACRRDALNLTSTTSFCEAALASSRITPSDIHRDYGVRRNGIAIDMNLQTQCRPNPPGLRRSGQSISFSATSSVWGKLRGPELTDLEEALIRLPTLEIPNHFISGTIPELILLTFRIMAAATARIPIHR